MEGGTMQLEDLEARWRRLDEKLDESLRQGRAIQWELTVRPARTRLNRSMLWPALDLAFCVAVLLLAGSVLGDHWGAWGLVVPACVLMLAAALLLGASIRQIHEILAIDWAGPVLELQRSLASLEQARIRRFRWIILLAPLAGFCGLIVALQSLLDRLAGTHNILEKLDPRWVAANYAFGLLFPVIGHALIGWIARRAGDRAWWRRLRADVSGTSLAQARAELERWTAADA
jgi:hypothetical protein